MRPWLKLVAVAVGSLSLGVLVAVFLFVELLHAPASHTVEAVQYFVTSGLVSLLAGSGALLLLSRFLTSLGLKIGAAFLFGSAAAIMNVIVTPLLMFSSRTDFYLLLITLIYFVAVSLTFAVVIGMITTRQLRTVHEGALKLAAGELGTSVEVRGVDEVADLARAFNHMSRELLHSSDAKQRSEEARAHLMAAVSHDLRTPVTSIRAMVEAIHDGVAADPQTVERYIGLIKHETERLAQLIDDLFELSRIERGALDLRLSSVPLGELVTETVDGMRVQAEEKGVALQTVCGPDVPTLPLDGPRMQRVLINLIQNAVRHTPSGGHVQVEVHQLDGHLQLAVADDGEGIAPEDQPHIFDDFYRGEKSRSRESGGAGLGLAIARGIVEAHSGAIRVESSPGHGARFVVTLSATHASPTGPSTELGWASRGRGNAAGRASLQGIASDKLPSPAHGRGAGGEGRLPPPT